MELLLVCHLIKPPALKKYLAALADAKVMVCVNVMVQADDPLPVLEVFALLPLQILYSVPCAAALRQLVVIVVRSVLRLLRIWMRSPVTGLDLEVIEVPWCAAIAVILSLSVAHCVAVTGRVPVRVVGSIRKGDRLVSAGSGLARAARPGEANSFNTLGRALVDKLDEGEGMVESVVTIH